MKQKLSVAPTLKNYDKKNLPKDILAGIIIMAVSIPISMGYAQISGLPAVYGLYGSVFPIILFALFSTSPQFIFGVDAAPAALVGAAVLGMGIDICAGYGWIYHRHMYYNHTDAGAKAHGLCGRNRRAF